MGKIIKRLEKLMLVSLGVCVLDVVVGCLFLFCEAFTTKINMIILGSLIIVHGLFYFIRYIYDGLGRKVFSIDLITGVVAVILGLFTVFSPSLINDLNPLEYLGPLAGVWMLTTAFENIYFGLKFRQKQEGIYPLVSFISLLKLIMGILVVFNPFSGFMLITRLVGLFLICCGLFEGMVSMLFRERAKAILDIFK